MYIGQLVWCIDDKRPLKIDKTKNLMAHGSLMKVESIAIPLTCI